MTTRIAAVQMDIRIADCNSNLADVEAMTREAAGGGARLIIFPEAVVTGYCYESLEEALAHVEPAPAGSVHRITSLCRELGVFVIYATLERADDQLHNVAFLVGPDGLIGRYNKTHLPFLGVDRFTTAGNCAPEVYEAAEIRVGMIICYDLAFPEITRSLALAGADLVAQMTNSPAPGDFARQVAVPARAWENGIYFARANRIGTERGFEFPGLAQICDPFGKTIAEATHTKPALIYADIDPETARNKRRIVEPSKFETNIFEDRRPELYGRIAHRPRYAADQLKSKPSDDK